MKSFVKALMLASAVAASPSLKAGSQAFLEIPYCEKAPSIDGSVNDAEWEGSASIPSLIIPSNKTKAEKYDRIPTEMKLFWDEDYLYLAYKCVDPEIYANLTKHDDALCKQDVCEAFIDQIGDSMQYIEIQVSPNNVVFDKLFVLSAPPVYSPDRLLSSKFRERDLWEMTEWNCEGLKTAAGRLEKDGKVVGWTVEMAIPAKVLAKRRGSDKLAPCEMRANFCRYDWPLFDDGRPGRDEAFLYWAPTPNGCPHITPGCMGWIRLVKPEKASDASPAKAN